MFEHLDDPAPPELRSVFRERVVRRSRTIRRRRRLAVGGLASGVALVAGVVGLYANAFRHLDDVQQVAVAGTADGTGDDDPAAGDPQTTLVVGLDTRGDGDLTTSRTDSIVVMRIDPGTGTVTSLAIPRDLAVDHPVTGEPTRINAILPDLGLSSLVTVVESQLGIPVDHVVQVDFRGFVRLVDLLGGLDVHVPAPVRDRATGLDLPESGCVRLDGMQALQFVRSRHTEVNVDGRWRTDPSGDLGRIARLQDLLVSALGALGHERPDPIDANRLADWAVANVVVSDSLDRTDLLALARFASGLGAHDVAVAALPVRDVTLAGGAAGLALGEGSDAVIDDFNSGAVARVDGRPAPCG